MAIKAFITASGSAGSPGEYGFNYQASIIDTTASNPDGLGLVIATPTNYIEMGQGSWATINAENWIEAIKDDIMTYASNNSISLSRSEIYGSGMNSFFKHVFNYTPGRSIVTGTGATGFQVSSTRDAMVTYSTKITTTATIAGGQEGYVVLEIAPTNSATAGDWKEVGRVTNGQALSLALTLQSIQPVSGSLSAIVPAGYYVKVRSVNTTGTPTYSMVSGQEVLL